MNEVLKATKTRAELPSSRLQEGDANSNFKGGGLKFNSPPLAPDLETKRPLASLAEHPLIVGAKCPSTVQARRLSTAVVK